MLTDRQVLDEMLTLFHAGYDSSAAGLTWTWHLLATHPEIVARAAEEAAQVIGVRGPDYDHKYTQQVIQESLRLYPPVWILMTRQAVQDTHLARYPIRKGSWVYLIPWATHRSERWFPEPLRFDPERFSTERIGTIPQHAYFPFGLGPHRCLGERFAMVEMTLAVATVLQHFRISCAAGFDEAEVEPHTAIRPRKGLHVQVEAIQCTGE